jgi:hypothetical protein
MMSWMRLPCKFMTMGILVTTTEPNLIQAI